MIKYTKIKDAAKGTYFVAVGTNNSLYQSLNWELLDVQKSDLDGEWYLATNCPMKSVYEKEEEEAAALAELHLTGTDVQRAIYKVTGKDFDDILSELQNVPGMDVKALKIEFTANDFYRGNPYVAKVGAYLGFSEEMLNNFFIDGTSTDLEVKSNAYKHLILNSSQDTEDTEQSEES